MATANNEDDPKEYKFSEQFISFNSKIESFRTKEFPRLKDVIYLDHAGATLYSSVQMSQYYHDLSHHIYGNPHSGNESSQRTSDMIEQIRYRILAHFHTSPKQYSVIFTSNCTQALKIVAETFQFCVEDKYEKQGNGSLEKSAQDHIRPTGSVNRTEQMTPSGDDLHKRERSYGRFYYLEDNHTSVVGMRELVKLRGASTICTHLSEVCNILGSDGHGSTQTAPGSEPNQRGASETLSSSAYQEMQRERCLFAFPAQSNFSGKRYPLAWIRHIQEGKLYSELKGDNEVSEDNRRWYVLLDAASYVTTSGLDLTEHPADFVVISFYKMFGFPTGLGALLVRNDSGHTLDKHYFGGGTVKVAITTEDFHVNKDDLSERFEDGTPPFLEILSLKYGFDAVERITGGMMNISNHTFQLARYAYHYLATCYHGNGQPVAKLYCDTAFDNPQVQGPIVNFNLMKPDGEYYGYAQVERLALVYNIHLRTSCFCNIGACQFHLSISAQQVKDNFKAGHVCGDDMDLIDGKPTGSIRISFGYMSTLGDVETFLKFINECFVDNPVASGRVVDDGDVFFDAVEENTADVKDNAGVKMEYCDTADERTAVDECVLSEHKVQTAATVSKPDQPHHLEQFQFEHLPELIEDDSIISDNMTLRQIFLYPIKSCGAFQVTEWPIGPRGLLYDREWMIVTETGVCLTQKREPLMCLIRPVINIEKHCLVLTYPGADELCLTLEVHSTSGTEKTNLCQSKVCTDSVTGLDCGEEAAVWLQNVLHRTGLRLVRQTEARKRKSGKGQKSDVPDQLSLANEAQFLLINQSSVAMLCNHINKSEQNYNHVIDIASAIRRFRANLVISTMEPFVEEDWNSVTIGTHVFKSVSTCSRCQMICINQETGVRTSEPLKSLMRMRQKKPHFGILMCHIADGGSRLLKVGEKLSAVTS